MKVRYTHIFLLAFVLLLMFSCSTKKNTFVNRQYHDVTAYFNVLFNGRDAFNEGFKKSERNEPAGFDEILPVFSFEFENVTGLIASDMQRTIEKTKKTVDVHSITAKPKRKSGMTKEDREFYNKREFNIMVDDAYLLMGKANVFLRDYGEAKKIFEFAILEYPKESSIFETRLWLAITQAQQGDIGTAENTLKLLEKDKNFPEKLLPTLNEAWTDIKIKQKNYPEAIGYLGKALNNIVRKATKIRYNYILAQLYTQIGDKAKALAHYDKVIKMNPPYFTSFNAQMAKAFSYDSLTQKSNIRKTLEKALKDSRNEEYLDQIYYALATVEQADNNMSKALEYYQKSISAQSINNRQKALSYNALANYYYDLPDYVKAYHYYDSSAKIIGIEHSRYEEITGKVQKLRKLAENLEFVQKQDSLQKIAQMTPEERDRLIEKRIEEASAAEKAQQEMQQQRQQQIYQAERSRNMNESTAQSASGQWYFYNTTALSLGFNDFQMRWGRRKLEDNWRRRNKGMQMQDIEELGSADSQSLTVSEVEKQKRGLTGKDKEFYLLDIPVGEEAMKESNKNILTAMFNIGEAYRDDLQNYWAAIHAFVDMNNRFPNSSLQPQAYIALYDLYTKAGDADNATYYKNTMAQIYPNNPQVKAALDPTFITQLQAQEKATEGAYMAALYQYTQANYAQAVQMAEKVITTEPSNTLLPQYYLLRALSTDYKGDTLQYRTAMNEIIEKFPTNDMAVQAKALLANLDKKGDSQAGTEDEQAEPEEEVVVNYSTADGEHYFAVLVNPKGDANEIKFNIIARNADFYLNENYDVSDEDIGRGNKLILVGLFRNKNAAMKYYKDVLNDEASIFGSQLDSSYTICVISDINLFLLRDSKYFTGYYEFFQKNY
ncbi:MAG: hypothetical protein LBL90_00040 [Prevotellaceae bacterium]|jgi:tetratricopeptide (TPR) repeat protein|nr:hypothetical protein [Prevotellaceae bacterium]